MSIILGTALTTLLFGGFIFLLSIGIGTAISALAPSFDASIASAMTTLGENFADIYHIIPGADALITILSVIIYLMVGYYWLRVGIFIYNEVTGSGGQI